MFPLDHPLTLAGCSHKMCHEIILGSDGSIGVVRVVILVVVRDREMGNFNGQNSFNNFRNDSFEEKRQNTVQPPSHLTYPAPNVSNFLADVFSASHRNL